MHTNVFGVKPCNVSNRPLPLPNAYPHQRNVFCNYVRLGDSLQLWSFSPDVKIDRGEGENVTNCDAPGLLKCGHQWQINSDGGDNDGENGGDNDSDTKKCIQLCEHKGAEKENANCLLLCAPNRLGSSLGLLCTIMDTPTQPTTTKHQISWDHKDVTCYVILCAWLKTANIFFRGNADTELRTTRSRTLF